MRSNKNLAGKSGVSHQKIRAPSQLKEGALIFWRFYSRKRNRC